MIAFSGDTHSWDDAFLPFFAVILTALSVPFLLCSIRIFRRHLTRHVGSIILCVVLILLAASYCALLISPSQFDARYTVVLVPPCYGLWALTRKPECAKL